MGSTITVQVRGGEELRRELQKLSVRVEDVLEAAVAAGADVIRDEANRLAPEPVIAVETKTKRGQAEAKVGPPEEHWYWRFLEFGAGPHKIEGNPRLAFAGRVADTLRPREVAHPGMAARPFLRPAADERQDEAIGEVADELREAVKGR